MWPSKILLEASAMGSFISSPSTRTVYSPVIVPFLLAPALSKLFPKHNDKNDEYSKYAALLDAPDYAVEVMWYGE